LLVKFFDIYEDVTLYAAVESTGGLENNWLALFYKLKDVMNIQVARLNPLCIKALYDA